jgi:aminoglycoside phosphotransferase (APT) family kinase protein
MSKRLEPLGRELAHYMARHWQQRCDFRNIAQIPGGASRETYMLDVDTPTGVRGLVVRRDPPSSLIDTERAHEYRTYCAVFADGVMPVPEPIVLEESPGPLTRPFSVMARVPVGQASPAALDEHAMTPVKAHLGERKWTLLGRLARKTPNELGVDAFMEVPQHAAARELAYWANVIRTDALHPQPIAQAAIRWLEGRMPPPPDRLTLVHGDYRTGNFMFTETGDITAVLDWEMAHIGDPLEDLAWSLDPLWSPDPTLAGRLLPREHAIDIWEQASGMTVDRTNFKWWQIFASLKALAIWISSAEDFANGSTREPILAMAGWPMIDRQNRILLDRLAPDSEFRYAEPLA